MQQTFFKAVTPEKLYRVSFESHCKCKDVKNARFCKFLDPQYKNQNKTIIHNTIKSYSQPLIEYYVCNAFMWNLIWKNAICSVEKREPQKRLFRRQLHIFTFTRGFLKTKTVTFSPKKNNAWKSIKWQLKYDLYVTIRSHYQ